ncbi:MAG TPA: response regulator transcription factor [Actinophytocola sp.]|uniref:response regulator transcription factor n=1 Tax=Actinophytocola sp. TaxID=1872138 RepID=UPI002DDD621C|nr:response regulator transcription factor [Actinophytocola sp.]HEV2778392.1 response regulator transcription factor [Actinophytocola sp.]
MRVLVVEDDRRLARLLTRGLLAEGFAVDVAHDGREGLWRAAEGAYDVIVLDILLPGLDGYRVCTALRDRQVWTPILMLTAKDGEYDEAEGLDSGADDYLTKPFSYVVLVARLRALIRRGRPARPVVLRAGDLELDPVTRRCRRGRTPIRLTAKEYAVLHVLMRRPEEVVTKGEVIEHVWDFASDVDPNLVEVYICALRRKVDTPFARHTITTVRGVGYRVTADGG